VSSFDALSPEVRSEIEDALRRNEGRLGEVFRLREQGVFSNAEIVARGAAAGDGAAGNLSATLRSILDDFVPRGPTIAAQSGRSIGGLLRGNPELSSEALSFLSVVRGRLDDVARNEEATEAEDAQISASAVALERSIENQPGVYVYTLPTYFRTPKKTDPDRFLYKIGMTERFVGTRVREQQRMTNLPEDPWTLRVYKSDNHSPAQIEHIFHEMLEAAGHSRATGRFAGNEWFATNLEFLDAIARNLGFEILEAQIPEE
jgi:hypothetical protein